MLNVNLYRLERLVEKAYQLMLKRQTTVSMTRHFKLVQRLDLELQNERQAS